MILSSAQSVLIGWAVVDILDRRSGTASSGWLIAAGACGVLLLLNAARSVFALDDQRRFPDCGRARCRRG